MLLSDKVDFESRSIKRDKEGHCLMIKESVQKIDTTGLVAHACNPSDSGDCPCEFKDSLAIQWDPVLK